MINRLEIRVPVEIASNKKKLTSFIASKINIKVVICLIFIVIFLVNNLGLILILNVKNLVADFL